MNFNFIPFKLNADISYFKDNIQYISSDNGVDLYKAKEDCIKPLMSFRVFQANLYFYESSLITVYIHLAHSFKDLANIKSILETSITGQGVTLNRGTMEGYYWKVQSELLGLIYNTSSHKIYLYFTLLEFSVL